MEEKQEEQKVPEPTDTEILFDEEEVSGFKVHPWRMIECVKITPVIEKIQAELKARKLTLKDFFVKNGEKIEAINIDQLIFAILPSMPDIFKITLDKTEEEISKIGQEDMLRIMGVVIRQNAGYIKNLYALTTALTTQIGAN